MKNTEQSIVAIATAYGMGSISIIRISGTDSLQIAQKLIKIKLQERYAHLCKVYHENDTFLDEAIVIYFKSPKSFTGEDIVEIQCHGGIILAKLILQACINGGARLANAGEFSKRAFINGKMDISKAENIASLINAKSEFDAKMIARNLKGDLNTFINNSRDKLIKILAYSEVSIDYASEDLPKNMIEDMQEQLDDLSMSLDNINTSSKRRITSLNGHKITIIGKPNVGKSSLLNELLQYQRAIISNEEGTTRDTIEEYITINSKLVKLIDTAGVRDSKNNIENIGIQKTIQSIKEADIIIALFDCSKAINENDKEILNLVEQNKNEKEIIFVLSKSDLPTKIDTSLFKEYITVSSASKNIKQLLDKIESLLMLDDKYDNIILTSQRQIIAIDKCIENIKESSNFLQEEQLEFFSYHIKEAIEHLSSITKTYQYEQLLDEIFGNFCLGK